MREHREQARDMWRCLVRYIEFLDDDDRQHILHTIDAHMQRLKEEVPDGRQASQGR